MNPATLSAVAQLRDDPTFPLMSQAEREEEAWTAAIQCGAPDDPDSLAAMIAAALASAPPEFRPTLPSEEPCRLERVGCTAPVSAIGRCMDCGATRKGFTYDEEPSLPFSKPQEAPQAVAATLTPPEPVKAATALPEPSGGPFLYRWKAATGMTDAAMADALNYGRSTIQGFVSGRTPERLDNRQRARLRALAAEQIQRIEQVVATLDLVREC